MKPNHLTFCEIHKIKNEHQGANTDEQVQAKKIDFCNLCAEKRKNQLHSKFLYENIKPQFRQQSIQNLQTINGIIKILEDFKLIINNRIDEQISDLDKVKIAMLNREQKLKNILQSKQNQLIQEIQRLHRLYQKQFFELKAILINNLNYWKVDLQELIDQMANQELNFLQLITDYPENEYNYKILKQHTLKEKENCNVMTFNPDDTILAAGCDGKIIFFNFIDKKLIYNSQVEVRGRVSFLKFISQQQLLTVFHSGYLQIWEQKSDKEFILKHHQLDFVCDIITCIDLQSQWLVCGAVKGNLSFWMNKKDQWLHHQHFVKIKDLLSVSLNDQATKLILGTENNLIIIFENSSNMWSITQKIETFSEVLRVKIFGDHFIIYESKINQLSAYKFKDGNFQKESEQKISGNGEEIQYYPIQQTKNGFAIKHSNYLSFLTYSPIQKKCNLNLQIYYENENFQGCLSNNAEYLIIWSENSKEYQVRQWMKLID